jgi:uncharacterized protein (TIGR02145 family)
MEQSNLSTEKTQKIIIKLKQLISKNELSLAINLLKNIIPNNLKEYSTVLLLERRLHDNQRKRLLDILSNEELTREYNKISISILELIDLFSAKKLSQTKNNDKEVTIKKGKALYKIPNQMKIGKTEKCIIRIAFDEEILKIGLNSEDYTVSNEIRMGETMQVILKDSSADEDNLNFKIRAINSQVQLIDEDDYTQWQFNVKPLKTGKHFLTIVIGIIIEQENKVRIKEIVLEEDIEVITGDIDENKKLNEFKKVEEDLLISFLHAAKDNPNLANTFLRFFLQNSKKLGTALLLLIFLSVGTTWGISSFTDWRDYNNSDTPEELKEYIKKHPKGRYVEKSEWRISKELNKEENYNQYLDKYPNGKYRKAAYYAKVLLADSIEEYIKYLELYSNEDDYTKEVENRLRKLYQENTPIISISEQNDSLFVKAIKGFHPMTLSFYNLDSNDIFLQNVKLKDNIIGFPILAYKQKPGFYIAVIRDSVGNIARDTVNIQKNKIASVLRKKKDVLKFNSSAINLGRIYKGEVIKFTIKYRNISSRTLKVREMRSKLQGLKFDFKKKNVPQNTTGSIDIIFDTSRYPDGKFSSKISAIVNKIAGYKNKEDFKIQGLITSKLNDERDAKIYPITKIGHKIWFTENLNYAAYSGSDKFPQCLKKSNSNEKYYNWKDAVIRNKGCPNDWRVPSEKDWITMFRVYSPNGKFSVSNSDVYDKIIKGGVSGLNLDTNKYYWSSKKIEQGDALAFMLNGSISQIQNSSMNMNECLSCRCVKINTNREFKLKNTEF